MKKILPLLVSLLLASCARFHIKQAKVAEGGKMETTELTATAFFSSSQTLIKLKAFQSDKTQSFGAGDFTQQGATNTVEALNAIARILELLGKSAM